MSAGKLELVPRLARIVKRSAAVRALEMSAEEAWQLAQCAVELGAAEPTQLRCGGGHFAMTGANGTQVKLSTKRSSNNFKTEDIMVCKLFVKGSSELELTEGEECREYLRAYWRQLAQGKHFLHEQPEESEAWKRLELQELAGEPQVHTVLGPIALAEIAQVLKEHGKSELHGKVHLAAPEAAGAAQYPAKLIAEVMQSVKRQQLRQASA
eukprot:6104249-Amphidinium_carterae.3